MVKDPASSDCVLQKGVVTVIHHPLASGGYCLHYIFRFVTKHLLSYFRAVEIELDKQFVVPGYEDYMKTWYEHVSKYYANVAQACSGQDRELVDFQCDQLLRGCCQVRVFVMVLLLW